MSDGVFMHRVMNSDRAFGTGCHGYVPPSYCGAQTRQKSPPLNNVKKTSLSYCGGQKANSLTSVIIMYELYQLVLICLSRKKTLLTIFIIHTYSLSSYMKIIFLTNQLPYNSYHLF